MRNTIRTIVICLWSVGVLGSNQAQAEQEQADVVYHEDLDNCAAHTFKTQVARVQCSIDATTKYDEARNYPYMDLVDLDNANKLKLAAKVDNKQISLEEAKLEAKEYESRLDSIVAQRNTTQAQNNSAKAQSTANALATYSAMKSLLPQPVPSQPPLTSPSVNTNCNVYGNSINCTSK